MGYLTKGSTERTKGLKTKLCIFLTLGVLCLTIAVLTLTFDLTVMASNFYSRVDYGTYVHEALIKETDSIHISAYLFNVTNAEQFLSGEDEKLRVQEVGPFTYQENRTNEGLEIDNEAGVIRYTPRQRVTFLPEESVADPDDVIVTMPNIAMLAIASAASTYGYLAKMGFNVLTMQQRNNATVTMRASDYLWGYNEPLVKFGNRVLPGWINFDKLGLLDRLYDRNASIRLEVSSRLEDKFMIKTVNGIGGLKQWGYENPETRNACNSFNNTYEGAGYPPEMTSARPIKLYRNVLCRSLELDYHGTKMMDFGVEGLFYKVSKRSYTMAPENQCLCSKRTCLEGVSDLSPCFYGLPLVLSNAHFLDADPAIYERIEGMNPNEADHGSEVTMDSTIGMVMTTKFSIQISVMMNDLNFNSKISRFSNMLVPILNLRIVQPKLPDDRISTLRLVHVYCPYLLLGLQVVLISAGLLLLSCTARLLYWNWIYARRKVIVFETKGVNEISKPLMR